MTWPTSGVRIGPISSHNTEYWHANTNLLFWLQFIHCALVSPFILHWFPFSLIGEQKRWEIAKEVSMNCMAYTYYVTCALHHPLKLLTSAMLCLALIQVNQDGFMLWLANVTGPAKINHLSTKNCWFLLYLLYHNLTVYTIALKSLSLLHNLMSFLLQLTERRYCIRNRRY